LPCFDRNPTNFPKERKIRSGRGANPDPGQGPEAGQGVVQDQDHQNDTGKGVRRRREKRRKGESPKANRKVQSLIIMIHHQKDPGETMLFKMSMKKNLWNRFTMPMKTVSTKKMRKPG